MRKDSVHGRFKGTIRVDEQENALIMNGNVVKFISADSPDKVDYASCGISDAIVIDNTGMSSSKEGLEKHLKNKEIKKVCYCSSKKRFKEYSLRSQSRQYC